MINSTSDDIVEKVKEITNGEGVAASFDSVGKDTFEISLNSIKRKGTFVSYGNASGPVTPFPLSILSPKISRLQDLNYMHILAMLMNGTTTQQNC